MSHRFSAWGRRRLGRLDGWAQPWRWAAWAGGLLLAAGCAQGPSQTPEPDPVTLVFATVGDSRADPLAPGQSAQDVMWAQNTRALARILREVQAQQARMLVFNGDMVMGYGNAEVPTQRPADARAFLATDLARLSSQYAYWRGMVATAMEGGTYIVPVPGNHEVQCFRKINAGCPAGNGGKNAMPANEDAWRLHMADLIVDAPRFERLVGQPARNFRAAHNPCPPGQPCTDGLSTDQTQLSYSFDVGPSHFTILNTDPVGHDGHAPTEWLAADLAQAQARGQRQFFIFGHRPATTYAYAGMPANERPGLDADPLAARTFWDVVERYQATYFCGHQHIFNAMQPRGQAWQVLVGSGGSPFDAPASTPVATDRMYAYAVVRVRRSGTVELEAHGFPDDFGATRRIWSARLAAP